MKSMAVRFIVILALVLSFGLASSADIILLRYYYSDDNCTDLIKSDDLVCNHCTKFEFNTYGTIYTNGEVRITHNSDCEEKSSKIGYYMYPPSYVLNVPNLGKWFYYTTSDNKTSYNSYYNAVNTSECSTYVTHFDYDWNHTNKYGAPTETNYTFININKIQAGANSYRTMTLSVSQPPYCSTTDSVSVWYEIMMWVMIGLICLLSAIITFRTWIHQLLCIRVVYYNGSIPNNNIPNKILNAQVIAINAECMICEKDVNDCIFFPCMHLCCCHECYNIKKLNECPICKKKITNVIRIYDI